MRLLPLLSLITLVHSISIDELEVLLLKEKVQLLRERLAILQQLEQGAEFEGDNTSLDKVAEYEEARLVREGQYLREVFDVKR